MGWGIQMKKRLMLLVILFSAMSIGPCLALTTGEVVRKAQDRYETIWSLTADFSQESTNKMLNQTRTTKGKVYFQKPGRMRWEYTAPPKDVWVSDGKTLWFYQPEEQQVIIERVDVDKGRVFLAFLVGEGNLARDFEIHQWDQEVDVNDRGYRIELTPKEPHAIMNRLILTFDRKTFYVRQADVFDAYGNPTRTVFKRIRVNRKLPLDLFTFVIPPGTEIIESPNLSGQ
jgi:outer membrane lipoprotein carrier protein